MTRGHDREQHGCGTLGVEDHDQLQRREKREAPDRDDVNERPRGVREATDVAASTATTEGRNECDEQREHDDVRASDPRTTRNSGFP